MPSTYGRALSRQLGLEGFWDDVYKVSNTVGTIASTVSSIKRGDTGVVVYADNTGVRAAPVPRGVPDATKQYLVIGAVALAAFLLLRKR